MCLIGINSWFSKLDIHKGVVDYRVSQPIRFLSDGNRADVEFVKKVTSDTCVKRIWARVKFSRIKGLFINDVITFGGYPSRPPPLIRGNGEKKLSVTNQRTPGR